MKNPCSFNKKNFEKSLFVTLALLVLSWSVNADAAKIVHKNKIRKRGDIYSLAIANPTLTYTSPQTWYQGIAINPLTPTSSGVAAPGYSAAAAFSSGFNLPYRVAFDAAGNAYVSNTGTQTIIKVPVGGGAKTSYGSGIATPAGVAVNAAGTIIYVADLFAGKVEKITVSTNTTVSIGGNFGQPYGVAVDAAGNVYVADATLTSIKKIPAGGGAMVDAGSGFSNVAGVAVDAGGNIYVADGGNNAIKKIAAGTGTITTLGSGFNNPFDVAVDASGDVFVADYGNNEVKEIPGGTGTPVNLLSVSLPTSVSVDPKDNVYTALQSSNKIDEIKPTGGYYISPALPAGLSFNSTTGVISGTPTALSPATTYTVTAYNSTGSTQATVNIAVLADSPDLSALTISGGTLTPAFAAATTGYTASVGSNTAFFSETPTSAVPGATITVNGVAVTSGSSSGSTSITTGQNTFTTVVTAPDGTTTKTYTLVVTRLSGDSYLSGFTVSAGTYTPAFATNTYNYTATVPISTTSVTVTPTTHSPLATVTVNNVAVASGSASAPITLGSGSTSVDIKVIAQDGTYTYYNIEVNLQDVPGLIYSSPHSYTVGTAIASLTPTNQGGGLIAPAYGSSVVSQSLNSPNDIVFDNAGNMYVACGLGVRKFPAGGGAAVTIGAGYSNGLQSVAVDAAGNVFAADYSDGKLIELPVVRANDVIYLAQGLSGPSGVAVDNSGNIYFSEYGPADVKMIPAGGGTPVVIATGITDAERLKVDAAGNIYVVSELATTITKIAAGSHTITNLGSGFLNPIGVAVDNLGNVFVADNNNSAVKEIPVGSNTPIVLATGYNHPSGVTVDAAGNVWVGNTSANQVAEISPIGGSYISPALPAGLSFNGTTAVVSGTPTIGSNPTNYTVTSYNSHGLNTATVNIAVTPNVPVISYGGAKLYTQGSAITPSSPTNTGGTVGGHAYSTVVVSTIGSGFYTPSAVAVDAAGNVYVGDTNNHLVKKYPVGGGAYTVIGTGFGAIFGLAVDAAGNVYVADQTNGAIKEIKASDGSTVTLYSGLSNLDGVAVDLAGNIYAAAEHSPGIVKIPPGGGSGVVMPKSLGSPIGVAVDAAGNVYEVVNSGTTVTKVPVDGSANVSIGSGLVLAYGVAVDNGGNVYVADDGSSVNKIKMYPANGGAMVPIGYETGIRPFAVAIDGAGNIYAADQSQTVIDKISPIGGYYITPSLPAGLIFNSDNGAISGTPTAATLAGNYTVTGYNNLGAGQAIVNIKTITAGSANANLSGLKLSTGALSPAFAGATTTSYSATVANTVTSITETPTAVQAASTIKVNGVAVTSGNPSGAITLSVGANVITTVVTAADGVTKKTYTVTVSRAASTNDNLSALHLSSGTLSPTFAGATTTSYTASVANTVTSITVTPTTAQTTSTVTVDGAAVTSGSPSGTIALNAGANVVSATVTAQDGVTTKTYTVTVTRAPSNNDNLSALHLSAGTLSPVFAATTTSYTATVANAISSITVTPTTAQTTSTVTVNGIGVSSGTASGAIALNVGNNVISTVVTAQDGATTKTYTITVSRTGSNNANLSGLKLSGGAVLSPTFAGATTTSYTASVANTVTSITVTPTTAQTTSAVKVNGVTVASGSPSGPIALSIGSNAINAVVTAQDGVTTKTYTVTVTRAGSVNIPDETIAVERPAERTQLADDDIVVHQGISPNGDGKNDFLTIDNIAGYPDNKLTIMNLNGNLIYEAKNYDNQTKVFNGHNNKTGQMQLPGTYFYSLEYKVKGISKRKTGFIVLKW